MADRKYLAIVSRDLSQKVLLSSILFADQQLRAIRIVTDRGMVTIRGKLGVLETLLPETFIHCHSYLIVNLERVEKMTDEMIFFDEGTQLKTGKGSYVNARKQFNQYLKTL